MIGMRLFLATAIKSLWHRKVAVSLAVLSIMVSVYVLVGIEHLREQTKTNFKHTVSGVDLIVGPRGSETNLLLYSVFQIGHPTTNISWQSYEYIKQHPQVAWTIPISLGDAHKGYRVIGTHEDYFEHYRYGKKQTLEFAQGTRFSPTQGAVVGAHVAQKLGYHVGDEIVLSHGIAKASFHQHDDHPVAIKGILKATGTPVDKVILVPLSLIEKIHKPASSKTKKDRQHSDHDHNHSHEHESGQALKPQNITAFMLGLKTKMMTFQMQHYLNTYEAEPLTAVLPGVALTQLWQTMGIMENTLRSIAILVLVAALMGLSATLLASMESRKQELKVLRIMGAHPRFVFALIQTEGLIITLCAIGLALSLLLVSIPIANSLLVQHIGMTLSLDFINNGSLSLMGLIVLGSMIMSCLPAISAYRRALG